MKLRIWRILLVCGLIFTGGGFCGMIASYLYVRHRLEKAIHAYPDLPGYADQVAARLQSEWGRELNLDASQSEMLRGELSATAHEIKQFRFDTVNRFQEICRNTLTRIESRLPAEKRSRFHALAEAESKRWDIPLEQ